MFFEGMRVENFGRYEYGEFSFSEINRIVARNGNGKSTIRKAIEWCIHGTSDGLQRADERLRRTEAAPDASMAVELYLRMSDGSQFTLERRKDGSKPQTFFLNGRKVSKERVAELFGTMDEFLSVFVPGYFSSLEPKNGRTILSNLLPIITHEEVTKKLNPEEVEIMSSVKFGGNPMESVEVFLKKRRDELAFAKKEYTRMEGEIRALEVLLSEEVPAPPAELPASSVAKYEEAKSEIRRIESALVGGKSKSSTLESLKAQKAGELAEYKRLQADLKLVVGEHCPTCGQPLSDAKRQELNRDALAHNKPIQSKIAEVVNRGKEITKEINRVSELPDDELALLEEMRDKVRKFEELQSQIQSERSAYQARLDGREKAKTQVEEVRHDISVQAEDIAILEKDIKAAISYRIAYSELQISQINKMFERVVIKLHDYNRETGEIKPVFSVMWDGRPYRVLSASEKVRCDLEIGNVISAHKHEPMPVFVDDADLIQRLSEEKFPGQIFAAFVGDSELTIEHTW